MLGEIEFSKQNALDTYFNSIEDKIIRFPGFLESRQSLIYI